MDSTAWTVSRSTGVVVISALSAAGGEHTQEPVLAGDPAVRAEDPDPHLERRDVPGERGAGGCLGEQQVRAARPAAVTA